jgi:hypothetical protein
VSDSEENDMDDEDYREILSLDQPLPLPFQFQEVSGPKHMHPADSPLTAYFHLFFTDLILTLMVTESNRSAQQVISSKAGNVPTLLKNWTGITMYEMKGLLACILNMGIIRKPTISIILVHTLSPNHPLVCENVYQALLFPLVNNEGLPGPKEPDYDSCARYQLLVDHANRVFRYHYTPHQKFSANQRLVGTKNKTSLMQYLPSSTITLGNQILHGVQLCVQLLPVVFHIGRPGLRKIRTSIKKRPGVHLNVFVNNYFMSAPFVCRLYQLSTYITGTVKRNSKLSPQQFKDKYAVGQKMYCRSGPLLTCVFFKKKSQQQQQQQKFSHSSLQPHQRRVVH